MFKIVNIRKGFKTRAHIVYAEVRREENNELCCSATLDYCTEWVRKELLKETNPAEVEPK